jgi:hypothetical protein
VFVRPDKCRKNDLMITASFGYAPAAKPLRGLTVTTRD